MKTYYVIRAGWNSANQSSVGTSRNPKNEFDSGYYRLLKIVEADCAESAVNQASEFSCYNGQRIFAVCSQRSVKGLTAAVRQMNAPVDAYWC